MILSLIALPTLYLDWGRCGLECSSNIQYERSPKKRRWRLLMVSISTYKMVLLTEAYCQILLYKIRRLVQSKRINMITETTVISKSKKICMN